MRQAVEGHGHDALLVQQGEVTVALQRLAVKEVDAEVVGAHVGHVVVHGNDRKDGVGEQRRVL